MLNQIILVGRLVQTPVLQVTDSGKKVSSITLAVPRNYKNQNGEYDTDFLDCTLWTGVAENTAEYCKTGDVIGVKGRLQTRIIEKDDETKYKKVEIVAERVTFLSSSKSTKIIDAEDGENLDVIDSDNVNLKIDEADNGSSEIVEKSNKVAKKKK